MVHRQPMTSKSSEPGRGTTYLWGLSEGDRLAPMEEYTRQEVARRREWEERPENVEARARDLVDRERAERTRVGKDGKPGLLGPPNPYKPHCRGGFGP